MGSYLDIDNHNILVVVYADIKDKASTPYEHKDKLSKTKYTYDGKSSASWPW